MFNLQIRTFHKVVANNYEHTYQFWFFVFFIHKFDVDFVVLM
jgi:hypothetical protein